MQTDLPSAFLATDRGARANEILRSCVHCGFCNATCPTYELLGDELDGPRGRIYLIKNMLEMPEDVGSRVAAQQHLDRCLTCRSCETTCPSGVAYGELLEIGRSTLEEGPGRVSRSYVDSFLRRALQWLVPHPGRFNFFAGLGSLFRVVLPRKLKAILPAKPWGGGLSPVKAASTGTVLVLQGCVQRTLTPDVNTALVQLLARHGVGVTVAEHETCCGSLQLHLGAHEDALNQIRANIDALAPLVDTVDAILSTASGCGVTVKDYGRLLVGDSKYSEKALKISEMCVDVAEYLSSRELTLTPMPDITRVAWHAPCTLQHGQRITGVVEKLLSDCGYELVQGPNEHLCCGSAGTYSILQPDLAMRLRDDKLESLTRNSPEVIATANVGCHTHLAGGASIPVRHWIELLG
jgi:glycolate oxidase iron-sulfur subunit